MTATEGPTPVPSMFARAHASIDILYREMAKFGAVGAVAFVVDIGVFNLMRTGIIGGAHGLAEKPLTAKTISVLAATVVAWVGNRYWTFRHRRRASRRREFSLFLLMNVGGLAIALACLGFSHYVLGLTSTLADNIAGNVVGLGLGTLFRFWAYRQLVFVTPDEQRLIFDTDEIADSDLPAGQTPVADPDGNPRPAPQPRSDQVEDPPAASTEATLPAGPQEARPGSDDVNELILDLRDAAVPTTGRSA